MTLSTALSSTTFCSLIFGAMDTLSSSVSTFKIPSLNSKLHEFHHLILISSYTKPNGTSIVSSLRTTTSPAYIKNSNISPFVNSSQQASSSKQPLKAELIHQKASSGYAVALLDAARRNNVLEQVERDVKRLSRWLSNGQLRGTIGNPRVEMKEKGEVLKEIMKRGMFQKHLVKFVNLLVDKAKFEILSEVLVEFERIYDELCGIKTAQVVLVSSRIKLEKDHVLGIAKSVQKISGATKVKVRQFVDKKSPLFAM